MHTSGLKIKILIAPVNWSLWRRSGQSRYLLYRSQDYQCNMAHWLYQRSIFNRRLKLHMTIKHVHKSLASINNNNKKKPFSISTLFVELISSLVNASMCLNYGFDFVLFYISTQYDDELMKWNIREEVRQATKSKTGTLRRSLEVMRCLVNTLPPTKIRL